MAEARKNGKALSLFLMLRGAVSLLFGIAVLGWGIWDQASLAMSFFLYALVDGLLALTFGFLVKERGMWVFKAEGIVSLLAAALTLLGPVAWSGIISHTGSVFLPYFIIGKFIICGLIQVLSVGFLGDAGLLRSVVSAGITAVAAGIALIYLVSRIELFTFVTGGYGALLGILLFVMIFLFRPGVERARVQEKA